MTPEKQTDWLLPFIGIAVGKAAEHFDGLTHKQVVAIAGGIITVLSTIILLLLQFGFTSMQATMGEIKANQISFAQKFDAHTDKQQARDIEQDRCIYEIKGLLKNGHLEKMKEENKQ